MWTATAELLVTDLGNELVLMHPTESQMFSLNAAGRLIWQHLPATTEELAARLAQAYALTPEQAQQDTRAVLDALLARQLVSQPPVSRS